MSRPIYTDTDVDYSQPGSGPDGTTLMQPPGWAVSEAEEEFAGEEVTWPNLIQEPHSLAGQLPRPRPDRLIRERHAAQVPLTIRALMSCAFAIAENRARTRSPWASSSALVTLPITPSVLKLWSASRGSG